MIYRPAVLSDIPQIKLIATKMVEGTCFSPPTDAKLIRIINNFYTECVWLNDKLIAFMAGQLSETFLNNDINAYEKGLFVVPEHRGSMIAVRLIKNFEAWAINAGAKQVWVGQSIGQNQDKTLHFFQRLGYECQGFSTCKKL